jgi:hypothetical protein
LVGSCADLSGPQKTLRPPAAVAGQAAAAARGRAYHRIHKISRNIEDLGKARDIETVRLGEVPGYRQLDRESGWRPAGKSGEVPPRRRANHSRAVEADRLISIMLIDSIKEYKHSIDIYANIASAPFDCPPGQNRQRIDVK